jgi:catechol 2,3-dioxygenase-like lactoylglutathione lyase family enzyme
VSPTILGVHHVAIQVDDLDAARRFYRDVMGLAEIADRPDFEVDGAWFQLGAHELHLGVEEGHRGPERQHFAVEVSDLDAAVAAIESHGVPVRKTGLTFPRAGNQAFLRDPSGNLIELNEPQQP